MDFPTVYIGFIIISIFYRIQVLIRSYQVEPKSGRVYFKLSYPILLALYLIIFVGAALEYFYLRRIVAIRDVNLLVSAIGLLMYIGVIPLRDRAVKVLGKYMSQDIKITENHKLVKEGPYRYMRHPLILCIIIEAFGLTLIPNSYYTLLFALLIFLPFNIFRMKIEEKALIEKFGQEYLDYKKEVYALLPLRRIKAKSRI